MIKGGGQGVLKRKNYWPQVFVALNSFVIERGKGSKRIACILTHRRRKV